jgi:hypothetical protein
MSEVTYTEYRGYHITQPRMVDDYGHKRWSMDVCKDNPRFAPGHARQMVKCVVVEDGRGDPIDAAKAAIDEMLRPATEEIDKAELLQLLATLESCVRYGGDWQTVQCPCCSATCTMTQWQDGIAPEHKEGCEWVAARRVCGIPGVPGIPE